MKPEFFKHLQLFELEQTTKLPVRIAYIGLWVVCDREGRFKWEPKALKIDVLPYDEVPFESILLSLKEAGFIEQYEVGGSLYGRVIAFRKHQYISSREPESCIPPSPNESKESDTSPRRVSDRSCGLGTGDRGRRTRDNGQGTLDISAYAAKRFVEPTLDEVKLLAAKAGLPDSEAEKFFNHYMANGWMVGKNRMKSVPHAIGYWAANWREKSGGNGRFQQSGPIRHTAEDYENDVGLPTTFKAPERKN